MMVGKLIRFGILIASSLTISTTAFATNGYFAHGYGTKNKGMAGSGVAFAQDGMIAATNPAGIVLVGERADVGAAIFSPIRNYSVTADNPAQADGFFCGASCPFTIGGNATAQSIDSDNEAFLIPHLAYVWDVNSDTNVGLAVYGNGGMNSEYDGGFAQHNNGAGTLTTSPGTFGNGTAGVNLEQLFISTTFSRKITTNSSWGFSAILAYQRFEAKGLGNFAGFSTNPSNLTNNGTDSSSGYGFKFGVQGELVKNLILAASYQSEFEMSEFDKYSGLFAEQGDFNIPSTWTIGMALNLTPASVVTFDVQRINYSDVPAIANPMNNLINTNTGCAAGVTQNCLGGSNGAGFGWRDMTIYKLGFQANATKDLQLRAGFSYGKQPIADSEVVFNILAPAVIEEHITLGFTYDISKHSEITFEFMHGLSNDITGANPLNPSQDVTLEMSQNEAEISWGLKF